MSSKRSSRRWHLYPHLKQARALRQPHHRSLCYQHLKASLRFLLGRRQTPHRHGRASRQPWFHGSVPEACRQRPRCRHRCLSDNEHAASQTSHRRSHPPLPRGGIGPGAHRKRPAKGHPGCKLHGSAREASRMTHRLRCRLPQRSGSARAVCRARSRRRLRCFDSEALPLRRRSGPPSRCHGSEP